MPTVKQIMDKSSFQRFATRKSNRARRSDIGKEHAKFAKVKGPEPAASASGPKATKMPRIPKM